MPKFFKSRGFARGVFFFLKSAAGTIFPVLPGLFAGLVLALTAALAATACMGALAPEGGTAAAGKVRVRLFAGSAGAESRSVIPKADFDSYALSFDSDDGYSHDPVVFDGAGPIAVDLEPGTWTISVIASKEGVPSGKGSLSAVIDASTTTLTIPIDRMVTGGDVNGTFAYTIGYPSGGYTAKTLIITNTDGTGLGNGTFTLKDSGVQDSIELPPGVYTAAFILADTDKRLSASRMEVVHIYAKQTSGFAFTFRDTDFYAQAIITGTASFSVPTLKDGQRVAREEILAFGDAACTQALGKESLDAGGGYTLFIPTSYAAVWLRPELTTGAGKKLYGKVERTEIPPDPAAPVTQNLISVFYAISASAVNGTITVAGIPGDTLAALPGDAVDFTVSPEADYHLIDGTVQVNGSGGGISGAGPYRFTMPGGGAALGAEFAKDTYTVGMDTMSNGSVTAAPPAGTAVPWGETITLRVSPGEDYELTADSLKANDGEVALSPGGGSSYSFVMPKADVRVSAEFEKLKYPLTLGALSNGVVASTSGHSFGASAAWGETISFKVIPDEGHVLTAVPTATGVTVNSLGMLEYSFVMPKHAVEVNAVFAGQAEATNWALLKAMVGSVEGGTVKIDGSFYTNRSIGAIVIGKPITLIAGGANRTITREPGHTSEFFIVESGGELTLGAGAGGYGITLDGNKYSMNARAQLILVNSRGSLIMNSSNSVLQNNYNEDGDSPRRGGAVSIQPYGSFTLNDGQILGNEFLNSAYAHGGGVFISGNAAFIMNGGTIGYGRAFGGGGVYNDSNGSFTLNSGDISDNHSVGGSYAEGYGGGGVYNKGTFTMNGGRILYNSANEGEKNLKLDGGVFNRNGGELESN